MWTETFLGVLLAPQNTFKQIRESNRTELKGFAGALLVVLLVYTLAGLRTASPAHLQWAFFNIFSSIISGIFLWLALVCATGLLASCYGAPAYRVRSALICFAWSFLPLIFAAPIECFHNLLGHTQVLLALVPLIWTAILQLVALNESYEFKAWQTLVLVFVVPSLIGIIQITQGINWLSTILEPFFG